MKHLRNLPPNFSYLKEGKLVRKTDYFRTYERLQLLQKMCHSLMNHPDLLVVPIVSFQEEERQLCSYSENEYNYYYSYDMLTLHSISKDEELLIDKLADFQSIHRRSPFEAQIEAVTMGQIHFPELTRFIQTVMEQNRYHDLHSQNVMIDNNGQFKLIDIEGFLITPYNGKPNYDWIIE
jgi:hypothetical protein